MPGTIKSVKVTYKPINEEDTFTSGDCVSGEVRVEVTKECQLTFLRVQFKGKSEVLWTERHGNTTVTYHSKDKYFSIKHYFIRGDDHKGEEGAILLTGKNAEPFSNVLAPGWHVYPFSFQIPFQDMPSSFTGSYGKTVYSLKARLGRSMRIDKKDSININFVTKDMCSDPELKLLANRDPGAGPVLDYGHSDSNIKVEYRLRQEPQHESKDKKMKFFNSGTVAMDVDIEKTGFFQGEGMKVVACIENNSTRDIKPKYCVYRKHSFFANGKRRLSTKDLIKEVGEPIPPSASEKVTRVITIPHDMEPSITNCSNMKVEYRLRVYLDVKYASDPEIKFPITILPASQIPGAMAPPAASGFGFEPLVNTMDIAPPQSPPAPQPTAPPPPYGAYGMYPPLIDFGSK